MEIYWIIGGMFVLPGVVLGVYEAVRQVFGYTNRRLFGDIGFFNRLGTLPAVLIQAPVVYLLCCRLSDDTSSQIIVLGLSYLLSFLQVSLREIPERNFRNTAIVISDVLLGGVAGGIVGQGHILTSLSGTLLGGCIAGLEITVCLNSEKNYHLFPFWSLAWILGKARSETEILIIVCTVGALFVIAVLLFNYVVPLFVHFIRIPVSFSLSKLMAGLKSSKKSSLTINSSPRSVKQAESFFNKRILIRTIFEGFIGFLLGMMFTYLLYLLPENISPLFASHVHILLTLPWWILFVPLGIIIGITRERIPARFIITLIICFLPLVGSDRLLTAIADTEKRQAANDMRIIGDTLQQYSITHNNQFPHTQGKDLIVTKTFLEELLSGNHAATTRSSIENRRLRYMSDGTTYTLASYGRGDRIGALRRELDNDVVYINGEFIVPPWSD